MRKSLPVNVFYPLGADYVFLFFMDYILIISPRPVKKYNQKMQYFQAFPFTYAVK